MSIMSIIRVYVTQEHTLGLNVKHCLVKLSEWPLLCTIKVLIPVQVWWL